MQNAECGMRNAECGMQNAECRMQNAECRMQNAECREGIVNHLTSRISVRQLVFAGVIAALYAILTIAVAPISYGAVQFRFAEVLCILPFFFPIAVPGLFIGCLVANLFSPYGIIDIAAGSLATLVAALLTMRIGKLDNNSIALKTLACFPPVIVNALIIGAVIGWAITGGGPAFWPAFMLSGLQVGAGQLAVLYVIGLPVMILLPKSKAFKVISAQITK